MLLSKATYSAFRLYIFSKYVTLLSQQEHIHRHILKHSKYYAWFVRKVHSTQFSADYLFLTVNEWSLSVHSASQKLHKTNIRPLRHLHLYLQTRMAHKHLSGMSLNPVGKVSLFLTHRHHLGTSASPLNEAWQGLHTDRANEASRPVVLYSSAQPRPPCCKADWGCLAGQSENLLLSNCPRSEPRHSCLARGEMEPHTGLFFLSCCNI